MAFQEADVECGTFGGLFDDLPAAPGADPHHMRSDSKPPTWVRTLGDDINCFRH
jgi:hypothetical protein